MAFTRLSEPLAGSEQLKRPHRVVRGLTLLCLGVALATLIVGTMALYQTRNDAWRLAQQQSTNLTLALERDITRNLQVFDLSIQSAARAYNLPSIDAAGPAVRHAALFGGGVNAEFLGSIVILDRNGNEVADSVSPAGHRISIADRDYFRAHLTADDVGLFVSRPYQSRMRGGDPSIAFSRRMTGPDGKFEGVVAGALRLAYFQQLFSRFSLGPNSTISLLRGDGHIIVHYPHKPGDIDRDIGSAPHFHYYAGPAGQFLGNAALDGVRRLFTFRRIGNLPLIVSVNLSVADIYADWWPKVLTIGGVMALLAGATLLLCLLLRRELARRVAVETALVEGSAKLAQMAATDGLTRLANRRVFDDRLSREWNRAIRSETGLALLLLDADGFKLYNDRYGHRDGDSALQVVAECVRKTLRRPGDLAARYGGEEFVVLLPETTIAGARVIAERIRASVEAYGIEHLGMPGGVLTVSIGVAAKHPALGNSEGALVKAADEALYEAKRTGRNRICTAGPKASPALAVPTTGVKTEV